MCLSPTLFFSTFLSLRGLNYGHVVVDLFAYIIRTLKIQMNVIHKYNGTRNEQTNKKTAFEMNLFNDFEELYMFTLEANLNIIQGINLTITTTKKIK